jgi:hypothetical protein
VHDGIPDSRGSVAVPWHSVSGRLLVAHVALAVAAASLGVVFGGVELRSGTGALLIAWVVLAAAVYLFLLWRRFVRRALEGYPGELPSSGTYVTGSVSSRVVLDFDAGTAEKAYGMGSPVVRWLYRACFQSPFPYTSNLAALETARQRRVVIGLLTQFWFGENLVAPIREVRTLEDGRYALVSELVRGDAPTDIVGAQELLTKLTRRFLQAGLPVWQVADYNPRAIGNLIEREDGSLAIIDLESNFVSPFLPPAAILRAIRLGQYPSFDDIDIPRLRAYIEARSELIERELGPARAAELRTAVDALAEAQARWFASERRWAPRVLRFLFMLVDVPSWVRGVRRLAGRGQSSGEELVRGNASAWVEEGRLTREEAIDVERALSNPEVALVLANLGAHLAITIPLRFPLGSLTRFSWTAVSRLRAEWRALRRLGSAAPARRIHTIPVMLATLLPSVGSAAYLLATPVRQNSLLEFIAIDGAVRRLPLGIHRRFHLVALFAWFARPKPPPIHWEHPSGIWRGLVTRWDAVRFLPWWFWSVIALNLGAVLLGAAWHYGLDRGSPFEEQGPLATLAAAQLLAAAALGILAYRWFWRSVARRDLQEQAGIFLWGISGLGLVMFAADDYFGLHERFGRWVKDTFDLYSPLTNNADDVITLAYGVIGLAVLHVFRHEVMQVRASSVLYLAGVVAAGAMLLVDAYGRGFAKAPEFPVQFLAVALLFLAHLQRFREVRTFGAPEEMELAAGEARGAPITPRG